MNKEQKDLLIKDLCARLPYGVWAEQKRKKCKFGAKSMLNAHEIDAIEREQYDFYKPYLFPLSNMTEEQKEEHQDLINNHYHFDANGNVFTLQDFYCKYHFDYRGLIPMGIANDATGLNIY